MFHKGVVLTPADFNGVDWLGRMRELGLNTLGLHSGGGAGHDVMKNLGRFAEAEFQSEARAAGLEFEYELHAPHSMLPRELYDTHPEYFVKPMGTAARARNGNWCTGHPDVLPMVGENGARLGMRLAPSTHRHFYWGEDSFGGWCHCDACRNYSAADQSMLSVNAIADRLAAEDVEAQVGFIAYASTLTGLEYVRPRPNVILEYAPIQRCYEHAIDDPHCEVNRRHWRALLDLLQWFDASKAHVLEYWLDSSKFSGWKKPAQKPRCRAEIVERDVKAYYSLGIRSFTTFAVYMDGEYFERLGDQELRDYAAILNARG